MKIRILAIGKVKERSIVEGIQEYHKRLRPLMQVEIIELKNNTNLDKYIGTNTYLLDSTGKEYTSEEFASFLKKKDGEWNIIIGDAEGFPAEVKKKFRLISLSKMTFPHEMCQLFLIEQIYRSCMINAGRKYHK